MKSINYYLRTISEKLNNKTYSGHFKDNFYLREIASSYGKVYDSVKRNNRYLHDWFEELTGESVDEVKSDWFYLRRIAGFFDGSVRKNGYVGYYVKVISELIDSKEDSSVSLSVGSVSPFVGDVVVLSGVLEPKGGVVKLYDGDSLLDTIETDSVDGSFSKSWTATLGAHSFKAVFEETEEYKGSESETVVVNVVKKSTILSLSAVDSSLFVDDDLVLNGVLLWNNTGVSGASVKLYQDDVLLDTLTTGNDGSFSKTVSGLADGDYVYNVVYDGTNVYESSESQDVNVEVSKYATSLSLNVPMSLVYSDSFNLSGVLTDENNTPLKNMSVKLLVDNVEKATTTTDNTGTASFTQTPVRTGNHSFQLSFVGTYKYEATVSSVVSRVVDKETSVLSVSSPLDNSSHYVNDDISVAGSLLEDDGVAMKSKSITVGDKGTVTTGNDGAFSKTISYDVKGTKTLTVSYAGDENYTASSVTRTLTLLQKTPVITATGSESEIYTNETVTISGTLKYNNNAVKNHSIRIYDGSTLLDTVTTNASGEYTKTVSGLTKGVHTLKAVSVETNEYESVTSSNVSVEVFNVITGVTIESDKSIISGYHSETCTLTAKLIDSDGAVVTKDNLNITFKKDGTAIGSAVATTDGIATKTFTASNGGELELKAEYSTFNDTCTVEDIYYYTDGKTNLNNWETISGVQITYTSNGIKATSNVDTINRPKLNITLPDYYSVEAKVTEHHINSGTTGLEVEGATLLGIPDYVQSTFEGGTSQEAAKVSPALANGDVLKLVYSGGNVSSYRNNSFIVGRIADSSYDGVRFRTYYRRSITLTDFKIRRLDLGSVLLASDKSILSYADGETCTLSATVKDSDGVAISVAGIGVKFYNGENLLGTSYTNSNGVATYTYTSTGVGDIVLSAKTGNNITSNTINIEDCYLHEIPSAANAAKYSGDLSFSYNNNGYYQVNSDASHGKSIIRELGITIAEPVQVTVESFKPDSGNVQLCWALLNSNNNGKGVRRASTSHISQSFTGGTRANIKATSYNPALEANKWYKTVFDLISTNINAKYYDDGTLVNSFYDSYNESISDYSKVRIICDKSKVTSLFYWKNLKIKAFNVGEIVLTSDKSILSYADSDSCTLTATLENAQGVSASAGIPVSFYNGATLLGTAYTNNNGVATYTYNSAGVGDMNVTAKAGNNITSNNINIEDNQFYDPATSDKSTAYSLNNSQTITYNNEAQAYQLVSSKIWGYTSVPINLSKPFILEADIKIISTGSTNRQPRLIFNLANDDWIGVRLCSIGGSSDDIQGHLFKNNNHTFGDDKIRYTAIQGDWYHMESIWDGVTLTNRVIKDNVLIGSIHTNNFTGETGERGIGVCCGLHTTGCQFKGLKLKPLTVDSISLTSDKSILSYADSETCTLTATVTKAYGSIANIPVQFYNGNVWLGTGVTDSNGVATYTYTSAGVGDMTVTAKIGSITSNTITIEDCTKYDPCTTDSGNWNIPTQATITFDSTDGAYLVGTANNVVYPKYNITYPTGDYSVEATVTKVVYDTSNVITRMGVNGVFVESNNSSNVIMLMDNSANPTSITQSPKLQIGDVLRFEYDSTNNKVTVYRNNNLVGTKAIKTGYNGIQFRSYLNRGLGIKNLKIKPQ